MEEVFLGYHLFIKWSAVEDEKRIVSEGKNEKFKVQLPEQWQLYQWCDHLCTNYALKVYLILVMYIVLLFFFFLRNVKQLFFIN